MRESITVSIGIAMLEDEIENGGTLIECADSALLCAKQRGRNRIEIYDRQSSASGLGDVGRRAS